MCWHITADAGRNSGGRRIKKIDMLEKLTDTGITHRCIRKRNLELLTYFKQIFFSYMNSFCGFVCGHICLICNAKKEQCTSTALSLCHCSGKKVITIYFYLWKTGLVTGFRPPVPHP